MLTSALADAVGLVAHFDFFLEGARLLLYYFPEDTLEALADVLRGFMMPAHDLVPDYDKFVRTIYDGGVFDRRKHSRDVVQVALKNLAAGLGVPHTVPTTKE